MAASASRKDRNFATTGSMPLFYPEDALGESVFADSTWRGPRIDLGKGYCDAACVRSTHPFAMAVSAQPGFKRELST